MNPRFQKLKNTILVSHEHLTKKLRNCFFCHQKGGSTYTQVNTVVVSMLMFFTAHGKTVVSVMNAILWVHVNKDNYDDDVVHHFLVIG